MDKKKALKIATATTVAASAFVSVAPATFAASTSTASKAVTKAEADAKKVKDQYNAKKLAFKKIDTKAAVSSYNKAVAEVKKLSKGKTKSALESKLKAVKGIHTYAANYNKALDLGAALATATKNVNDELKKASFDLAGAKKDQAALKTATTNFSKHVVKGTVYGESPRAQFTAKYLTPAKTAATAVDKKIKAVEAELSDVKIATADVVALESAVKGLKDEASVATAEKLLTAAKASFAKVDTASVKTDLSKRISAAEKTLGDFKTEWNEVKTATADVVKLEEAVKALKDDASVKAAEDALAAAKASFAKVDTESAKADLGKRIEDAGKAIEAKKAELAVPKVESVSAITTKKVEVKFSKAVDSTKATFEVKKGSSTINVATVTFNEDKTSAVLEFSSKLSAGDYTVNVKGVAEETLTGSVTVDAEKVTNVELLATEAPITAYGKAVVGYKVTNQYGEDITSDVTLNTTDSNVSINKTDKTITVSNLDLSTNTDTPDSRTFTLVHSASGLTKTVTVKATAAAVLSEVQVKGVYNKDGKQLVEGTNIGTSTDEYYLEFEAKDQYGNVLKASDIDSGLYLAESNSSVVDVKDAANTPDVVEFTTKDGVKKTGIKLQGTTTAGSNLVTLVAAATGKSSNFTINVEEAAKANTVSMNVPDLVVAGEDLLIPVSVTDTKGNYITDATKLTSVTAKLGSVAGSFVNDKDGKLFLEFDKSIVTEGKTTLFVLTPTGKAVSQLVEIKEAAAPALVQGLKADVSTAIYGDKQFADTDFIVKDQYGRTVEALPLGYSVNVKVEAIDDGEENNVLTFNDTLKATAFKKGTEQVTFALYNSDGLVENSEKAINLTVVEKSDFVSYGVDSIPTVFADSDSANDALNDYDQQVKVYGLTSDGKKVYLRSNEYNVTSSDAELDIEAHSDKWAVDGVDTLADNTNKTAKITVTLNETGQELVQSVVVSNVEPKVEKVENKVNSEVQNTVEFNNASADTFSADDAFGTLFTTDSYGVEKVLTSADQITRVTFTNVKDKDVTNKVTISANGTGSAALGTLEDGDTFDATIYVGGKSVTLNVTVK
ncbi:hypothetical protein SAMN05428981_101220 [Bacillus sp. OV194]|nr:hypothetical protein SAMN05428981_101220 [Bacillus sp. OV194]